MPVRRIASTGFPFDPWRCAGRRLRPARPEARTGHRNRRRPRHRPRNRHRLHRRCVGRRFRRAAQDARPRQHPGAAGVPPGDAGHRRRRAGLLPPCRYLCRDGIVGRRDPRERLARRPALPLRARTAFAENGNRRPVGTPVETGREGTGVPAHRIARDGTG